MLGVDFATPFYFVFPLGAAFAKCDALVYNESIAVRSEIKRGESTHRTRPTQNHS